MSNVERFGELLRSDECLQAKLRAAAETYQGDKSDEGTVFAAVVAPLAAEVGLPFTYEEAAAFAEADREVSLNEADGVTGAGGYCIIVGIDNDCDAGGCWDDAAGGGACAYVGVGYVVWW